MTLRHSLIILTLVSGLVISGVNAGAQKQDPTPQSNTPKTEAVQTTSNPTPQETKQAALKDNPVVCKNVKMEGTRLRKRKVCKTKELWDAERKKMNDDLDKSRRAVYTGS